MEADWFLQDGSSGGRTKSDPIVRCLRVSARSVAALRRAAVAMIEQQKRKAPELPLVPVKRQRHELLLGAAGSGPGTGQPQAAPGALLQAVSEVAGGLRPSAHLPLRRLHPVVPHRPFTRTAETQREALPGVKVNQHCKSTGTLRMDAPSVSRLHAGFRRLDGPVKWH